MRFLLVLGVLSSIQGCSPKSWPYGLPDDVKYYLEDEKHVKRELQAREQLGWQRPLGVKKMSEDAGEKFFLHYWSFDDDTRANATLLPAVARHTNHDRISGLFGRDFKCPGMTNACSDVDSPLCCPDGQDCVKINGAVGCCPSGEPCADSIGDCDTSAGYKSCPNSPGGGCCIPGAECKDTGCMFYGTDIVTLQFTTAVQPSSTPTQAPSTADTITVTVTTTVGGQVTTVTAVSTIVAGGVTCSSGFQSCPSTFGGGCCPNDRACGTSGSCIGTTSPSASPPIRPTSVTDSVTGAAVTPSPTSSDELCPTGFYMCEARYLGGCCRVGRDCQTTSCPTTASTTVIGSGPTVVVPVPTTGSCPNGWALCAAESGGGCCPSGFLCGQSCTATVSGVQNTGKLAPSEAASLFITSSFVAVAVIAAVLMIVL